jgi:hypothetical protein
MAHFAKLDKNNTVVAVTYADDKFDGKEVELSKRTGHTYKQTSYNTLRGVHFTILKDENGNNIGVVRSQDQSKAFRKNFAGIGFTYDESRDAFIEPKPYPSWRLDEDQCSWKSPLNAPRPSTIRSNTRWIWDEDNLRWQFQSFNVDLDIFENAVPTDEEANAPELIY